MKPGIPVELCMVDHYTHHVLQRVAADPVIIAALDMIVPGLEAWANNAWVWDSAEVIVNDEQWRDFYWWRCDQAFTEQVARRYAGSSYDSLAVLAAFESSAWEARDIDVDTAIAYLAQGWRVEQVPPRNDDRVRGQHSSLYLRWAVHDHQRLPLILLDVPFPALDEPF